MDLQEINNQFEKLLEKGVEGIALRKKIGMSATQAATYRHDITNDSPISLEKKIRWLQKAGYKIAGDNGYSHNDLVGAVKEALRSSEAAKRHGAEYIVEKYLTKKNAKS